jgi:endonuclease/exonuclease/phosphatase family metal-dependent hydrolase
MAAALRVASFNIRNSRGQDGRNMWWLRRRACVAAIRELAADVVGLQEVRPIQLGYLRRRFPGAAVLGAGRDRRGGGEHASVLLPSGAWTVESSETRWLSPTPDRPGSRGWDAGHPRVVTLARLRRGDTRVGVANTHFDAQGRAAQLHSARLLASWLAAEPDQPWVIVGDLNAQPGSAPLRALTDAGYADALAGTTGGTEHGFTGAVDRTRIDHILLGPGVGLVRGWISYERPGGRLPSDHWPVVADVVVE